MKAVVLAEYVLGAKLDCLSGQIYKFYFAENGKSELCLQDKC